MTLIEGKNFKKKRENVERGKEAPLVNASPPKNLCFNRI